MDWVVREVCIGSGNVVELVDDCGDVFRGLSSVGVE